MVLADLYGKYQWSNFLISRDTPHTKEGLWDRQKIQGHNFCEGKKTE